jgi:ABC-type oligopeptide transport system ATPase subunit
VHYPVTGTGLLRRERLTLRAVEDVSFVLREGETLGVVGETGCGKSSLGKAILQLVKPTSGRVVWQGRDLCSLPAEALRPVRREMQIIFQDPYSSLNPRMRAADIVEEPLVIHKLGSRDERRARAAELFELVGLERGHLDRYPHEFSGGQRQRIGIARALALNPSLIVADEAVSALDVSIQAQVVQLLLDLQATFKLTYLFIAHDLRLVEHICHRVAVMYRGRIVEMGNTRSLFANPGHPYTRALLSAIPVLDPDAPRNRIQLDPASFVHGAALREVGAGHWAAV